MIPLTEDIKQQEDNNLDSAGQDQMPQGDHEESNGNVREAQTAELENPSGTDDGSPLREPNDALAKEHQIGSDIISSGAPEAGELHSLGDSAQLLSVCQKNSSIQNDEDPEWKSDWDGEEENEVLEWKGAFPQSPEEKVNKALPIM